MATQLSQTGLEVDKVDTGDIPTGATDKVLLYASGSGSDTRLYVKAGANTQKQLGFDIDQFDALGGTGVAQGDHFIFSDAGTEKKITFSNMEDAIFGNVSGDVAIAAGGAVTIQADAVESGMLNDDVISGQTELASDGLAAADELMISDGGTLKKIGVDNLFKDGPGLLGAEAIAVGSDHFMFLDGGATGDAKVESVADLMTAVAGDGLAASSGVLAVGVDDSSIELNSDALRVKASGVTNAMLAGSIADSKLNQLTSANKVSLAALDIDGATALGGASVAQADLLVIDDGAGGTNKSVTFSNFEDSIFANISGDATIAAGGALTIAAQAVENSMLADDAVGADELAANAVVNASVASNAAIAATKLDFNVDLGGNVTFGDQANDTVTFTGHVNVAQQLTASHAKITNLDVVTLNSIAQTESTLEVADKLIISAVSASSANSDGGGLKIGGGHDLAGNASVLYDHSNTALDFNIGGTTEVRLEDGVLRPETDSDVDLGTTAARFKDAFVDSITVTGEIDGASLDISGNADIDGTLEADAITVNGATLQVVVEDHVGAMLDGTETGISVSYDSTDNNLDFVIDAAQTAITSILATDLKIGEDDQTKIDFETADEIHFYAANAEQVYVADGVLGPQTDSDVDLGADGVAFKKLYVDDIDLNGQGRIDLDADADTSIRSAADDQIQFEVGGGDRVTMTATGMAVGAGYGAGGTSFGVDGTINAGSNILAGADGSGANIIAYGGAANELMRYDASNHVLQFVDSSGGTMLNLGGDATSEYALDVANGSNNINKVRAAAFVTYSDESLKSDVASMGNTALDTVMSLKGVEFTWKDSGERDFGFIAQDVQSVLPKAVHTADDGVQGVDYSRLTSVLVEAVKAQQVQIEELKALLKK
jgi:hypothetical protein